MLRGICAAVLLWVAALSVPVQAQPAASVAGKVVDTTGRALPGVVIDLINGGREWTTVTDDEGRYEFANVPPGPAEATFRLLNFNSMRRTLDLPARGSVVADIVMPLSLSADVVVTTRATFRTVAEAANPAENLVGLASSASQGAITADQLDVRPLMRAGEVLETVPGMIVSQHSGEGKANQYYLRGFNLDHGTDFAVTVAGVPVNMPSGAHAHGYADANFLIPELVSGVQFRKGPYFADEGDFSAAGAANINYVTRLERPIVDLSGGAHGWGRLLAAASSDAADGQVLGAIDLNHNDGPWERPDDYRRFNGVARFSRGDHRNGFSATAMSYWARWDATDQVPARALQQGLISRFGLLDPSDGGRTSRHSAAVELQRSRGPSALRATGFVMRNTLDLFSNFTYFLDDPFAGDQFEQQERRVTAGGRVTYRRLGHIFDRHVESAVGTQVRRDWIEPVGLHRTTARHRLSTVREDEISQTMFGGFAQAEVEWSRAIRTMLGLRVDDYRFAVAGVAPLDSGDGAATLLSPKVGVVVGPWHGTELYGNAGFGFHSNDARASIAGADGGIEPVTPLVRARGAEVGVRTIRFTGVQSSVAFWYLGLDSELVFVGDAGTTEAGRPSRRYGIEWSTYARLPRGVIIDADLSLSRARFADDVAGRHVPGALDRVISAGVTLEPVARVDATLRVRHFGPRPLVEDATVASNSSTTVNGELAFRFSDRLRMVAEGFNLFDARVSDIDYFYRSRLPGEPSEGVEDLHSHPALPRSLRIGVRILF